MLNNEGYRPGYTARTGANAARLIFGIRITFSVATSPKWMRLHKHSLELVPCLSSESVAEVP